MKKTITLFAILAAGYLGYAQDVLLYQDFSSEDDILVTAPSGNDDPSWINFDFDGLADANGRPQEWYATFGFAIPDTLDTVYASSSWLAGFLPGNRNYLITPKLNLGAGTATLSWKSAPYQTPLYIDGYAVVVSTTDNLESSFTDTIFRAAQFLGASADSIGTSPIPQFNWYVYSAGWVHGYDGTGIEEGSDSTRFTGVLTEHTVDLSAYAGQSIHIAFIHNSDDDNLISIDDIMVTGTDATSLEEDALRASLEIFPNPATELISVNYELVKLTPVVVEITDAQGRIVLSENRGIQMAGNHSFSQDVSKFATGTYQMSIKAFGTVLTQTFVVK